MDFRKTKPDGAHFDRRLRATKKKGGKPIGGKTGEWNSRAQGAKSGNTVQNSRKN